MLVLDTDHLIELGYQSTSGKRLSKRLGRSDLPAVITIVSAHERIGGALSRINQINAASVGELVLAYDSLTNITDYLHGFTRLPFDKEAAAQSSSSASKASASAPWISGSHASSWSTMRFC